MFTSRFDLSVEVNLSLYYGGVATHSVNLIKYRTVRMAHVSEWHAYVLCHTSNQ